MSASWGANAGAVLAQYPLSNYGNDTELAYNRVASDPKKCGGLHVLKLWAAKVPTYGWDFTYTKAPFYFPKMPYPMSPTGSFQPLASHTTDIQFLFPGYHGGQLGVNLDQTTGLPRELEGAELTLSDQMVAAWTLFAKNGDPNGPRAVRWPVFPRSGEATFLRQDIPNGSESEKQFRANYKCDLWDSVLTYPL